jgi:hypothetical protein
MGAAEVGPACLNGMDDDADLVVDDGCPATPEGGICGAPGSGLEGDDDTQESGPPGPTPFLDNDTSGDDGCVKTLTAQETCAEILDDGVLNADEDAVDAVDVDVTIGAQPGPGGGIPGGEIMTAFSVTLNWDVDLVDSTAANGFFLITSAGGAAPFSNIFAASAVSPNSHGIADAGPGETGPGVLTRMRFTADGNGSGLVTLTLSGVDIKDAANVTYPITTTNDGTLIAVDVPCPASTDISVPDVVVTPDASPTVGVAFDVDVDADIGNTAGVAVNTDVTVTLAMPPDCTTPTNPIVVNDYSAAAGTSSIPTQTFSVTCTDASEHSFSATVSAVEDDPAYIESAPGNNSNPPSGTNNSPQTTDVTAVADLKITDQQIVGFGPDKCPDDVDNTTLLPPPDGIPDSPLCTQIIPLPAVITGVPVDITVEKDIHNNGPYKVAGTTEATITKGAVVIDTPGVLNPATCLVAPPGAVDTEDLTVSSTVDHDEAFTVTCTFNGIGIDDDGDTFIDEGDVDDPKFETPTICFSNTLTTEEHVDDNSTDDTTPSFPAPVAVSNGIPDNNEELTCQTVLLERPFTPTFTKIWDEDDVPSDPIGTPPTDDDCILTIPCEIKADYSVNALGSPQDEPLAGLITTYPGSGPQGTGIAAPAVLGDYALYVTRGDADPQGRGTVLNGTRVGNVTFSTYIDSLSPHDCSSLLPGSLRLYDAALPAEAGEGPNVDVSRLATPFYSGVITAILVDFPVVGVDTITIGGAPPFPTPSGLFGTTFIDTTIISTATIVGNTATMVTVAKPYTGGAPSVGDVVVIDSTFALVNPQVYPVHLESDPVVASVAANYGGFPAARAAIWAHYEGIALAGATQVPVNYLVFSGNSFGVGDDWHYVAVTGDPTQPSGINQCTPFTFGTRYQGEVDQLTDEEPFWLCLANREEDGDGIINDGCPQIGATPDTVCGDNLDDDAADDIGFVGRPVIDDGCPAVGTGFQQDLITCETINTVPGWIVSATWIREDTGQVTPQANFDTCSAENDVEVEKSDNLNFDVSAGLPHTETVTITVTNGPVPSDINVWATLNGPSVCSPTWDDQAPHDDADTDLGILVPPPADAPLIPGPEDIGGPPGSTTTRIAWREMGMGNGEVRVVTRDYTVTCPGPIGAMYNFQVVVNAGSIFPDPDEFNNQDENQPKATVTDDDEDDDGAPNDVDNCPFDANPNQNDADNDGEGNVCDDNDDEDLVLDATDECSPGLGGEGPLPQPDLDGLSAAQLLNWTEDEDGVDDADGCPDTATEVKNVIKNNPIEVDVSENHQEAITATMSNKGGGITADLESTWLLRSPLAGDCQADWLSPQPGAPHNPADQITSQNAGGYHFSFLVHTDLAVLPGQNRTSTHTYSVHCTSKSTHDNAIRFEVSVAPKFPVREELNDVSDNVHKQDIDITAYENADVKKLGVFLLEDPVIPINTPTDVTIRSVLHNNGPFGPVTVTDSLTVNAPADCTVDGAASVTIDSPVDLPVSINVVNDEVVTIECSEPSSHEFELENEILGIVDSHVNDTNPDNNSASGSFTQVVEANVDIDVTSSVTSAPTELFKAEVGTIEIEKTISYNGDFPSVEVEVRKTVTTPGPVNGQQHCYSDPPGDIFQATVTNGVPLVIPESFDVHCIDSHVPATFTIDNEVTLKDPNIHIVGQKSDSTSDDVDIIIGVDYSADDIDQVDPATGDCPSTGPITVIQDKHYPTHFCIEDSKLPVEPEIYAETPLGGLPDPNSLTPIEPGALIKDVHYDLKIVRFVEPGWHHCIGTRCTVNGVPVPASTIVWQWWDPTASHSWCVVQPSNNTPYVVGATDSCYLDYWLNSLEVEWKKWDNAIQQWIEVGRHRFQEKAPAQWDDKHTLYIPSNVASLLSGAGYTDPEDDDQTPDGTGVKDVQMQLEICINQDYPLSGPDQCDAEPDLDIDDGNDVVSTTGTVTVLPDPDADSFPTGQDDCPDDFDPAQLDSDGDTIGDACDPTPFHDDGVKYCNNFGPGAINISDPVGAYMWIVCEIGNFSGHNDKVHLDVSVLGDPDCVDDTGVLIVPGQSDFVLLGGLGIDDDSDTEVDEDPIDGLDNDGDTAFDEDPPNGEQKFVLFRVRYECHGEISPGMFPTTITVTIDHQPEPGDGDDTNPSNDSKTIGVNIIVSDATP